MMAKDAGQIALLPFQAGPALEGQTVQLTRVPLYAGMASWLTPNPVTMGPMTERSA